MDILATPGAEEVRAFDLNAIGDEFLENPFPMYRALLATRVLQMPCPDAPQTSDKKCASRLW